jgi:hypothetical protein
MTTICQPVEPSPTSPTAPHTLPPLSLKPSTNESWTRVVNIVRLVRRARISCRSKGADGVVVWLTDDHGKLSITSATRTPLLYTRFVSNLATAHQCTLSLPLFMLGQTCPDAAQLLRSPTRLTRTRRHMTAFHASHQGHTCTACDTVPSRLSTPSAQVGR